MCVLGAGRERASAEGSLWAQQRAGRVDKKRKKVFESGEQEKTGVLIGGCQGDGTWGLLNFFSVLPPELREAIECPPGPKAEGSGVDPGPGEDLAQGDRDATATRPAGPVTRRRNQRLGTVRPLHLARSCVHSLRARF